MSDDVTVTLADETVPGRVVWRGDHLDVDVAVVRTAQPLRQVPDAAVRYGELRGTDPVECQALGYPAVLRNNAGDRRLDHLRGPVLPMVGTENDRYALNSTQVAPNPLPPVTDKTGRTVYPTWYAGMSGAALLTSDDPGIVLGVLVAVPAARYGPGRLEAARISPLLADITFSRLVGAGPDDVVAWPATALPTGAITHDDAVSSLPSTSNLRNEQLPYVAPATTDPLHPSRILDRLSAPAGDPAILLVGSAGIGKTRCCLEVGDRAVAAGWKVVHLRPSDRVFGTDELIALLSGPGVDRLLLIIDYLNESGLDFPALKHRVLPEARRRGIRLALLASARPGWFYRADSTPAREVFTPLMLQPSEQHLEHIQDQIIAALAPTARTTLGEERLRTLCGRRPIIAMLIAAEAESQAREGMLRAADGLRPEQLLDWLTRRLTEDRLTHTPADLVSDDGPNAALLTCATLVAAMPQDGESVLAAGRVTQPDRPEEAERILGVLRTMGWVADTPEGVSTVHDIVTDQLIEGVTVEQASGRVRRGVTDVVLSGALVRSRGLGRFAVNLGRLMRDLSDSERGKALSEYCAAWLTANSPGIGTVLATDGDEGAYALGAMMDNPAWAPALFDGWDLLVGSWLDHHGVSVSARHLLYKGLRAVAPQRADHLIEIALEWLDRHRNNRYASFVVAPLLNRRDMAPDRAARAVDHALSWLGRHNALPEAVRVIQPLLYRPDLTEDQAGYIDRLGFYWMEHQPESEHRGYLLPALLGSTTLSAEQSRMVLAHGLQWLAANIVHRQAAHVLAPLLSRDDLTRDQAAVLLDAVFSWLAKRSIDSNGHILSVLLRRTDLTTTKIDVVIGHALDWLAANQDASHASFVLPPLLERSELSPQQAEAAIRHGMAWLTGQFIQDDADFTMRSILERRELSADQARTVADYALVWLGEHGRGENGAFLLRCLLLRTDLDEQQSALLSGLAMLWLDENALTEAATFIFGVLLIRCATDAASTDRVFARAVAWLDANAASSANTDFVLRKLLNYTSSRPENNDRVVTHAIDWLSHHSDQAEASFLLDELVSRPGLDERQSTALVDLAMKWLEHHALTEAASFVFGALLTRPALDASTTDEVFTQAVGWLDANAASSTSASFVLVRLLANEQVRDRAAVQVAPHALAWLDARRPDDADFVLRKLLSHVNLRPEDNDRIIMHAVDWLSSHLGQAEASFLLQDLTGRDDLSPTQAAAVLRCAVGWLEQHCTTAHAIFVMKYVLGRHEDAPESLGPTLKAWAEHFRDPFGLTYDMHYSPQKAFDDAIASVLLDWIDEHPDDVHNMSRLCGLSRALDQYGELGPRIVRAAERWLDSVLATATAPPETDFLLELLCSAIRLRTGISGALLDDLLVRWVTEPAALQAAARPTVSYESLGRRLCAVIRTGRFAPPAAESLLRRLLAWVPHWRPTVSRAEQTPLVQAEGRALLALYARPRP
nr:hypothetical protein [Actinoplanes lichenis]